VLNEPIEPEDSADENDSSLLAWLESRPSRKQCSLDLREFYPDTVTFSQFQRIFKDQIDPILKTLHLPSLFSTMTAALVTPGSVAKSAEAVLLCFCLATVSTMSQDQCQAVLKQDRASVVRKYKKVATQALTNAGFVQYPDLTNLQAFSLYLVCFNNVVHVLQI
jgi:hypothetical protein